MEIDGLLVEKVLIEARVSIVNEFYIAILMTPQLSLHYYYFQNMVVWTLKRVAKIPQIK